MKVRAIIDGSFGGTAYKAGDMLEASEHASALLASGLADPADKEAEALLADRRWVERHARPAYAAQAKEARAAAAKAGRGKR